MDEKKYLKLMEKYMRLQDLYRKKFFSHIEDKVVGDIHVNDYLIFPNIWFNVYDYEFLTKLLEESLSKNKKIEELDSYNELMGKMFQEKNRMKL